MSRRIVLTLVLATAVVAGAVPPAGAQLSENLGALTEENAKKYLGPLPDALSGTMNSAIFTTGKVPQAGFTFQLGIKVMGVTFDDRDRSYTPTDPPGFNNDGTVPLVPTAIGDETAVPDPGQGGTIIYYPGGFNVTEFAFAAPQLEIGSVLGTRAVVRWAAASFGADNVVKKLDFFGIGAQHSISQYFSEMTVDLAAGLYYQSFKLSDNLLDSEALHFNVTGSKEYGVLQPYVGIGMDTFKMSTTYEDANNPGTNLHVDFDRTTHFHLTAGLLANLRFVKIHAEANIAARNGVAVGLSFGN